VPLYEYECAKDGRFELIRKFSDAALTACPTCGSEVEKLFSSPAVHFKGSGWYVTDYARKGTSGSDSKASSSKADEGKSKSEETTSADTKAGDTKAAETKPATKSKNGSAKAAAA
jgi:putative FmdB family regulatory protein